MKYLSKFFGNWTFIKLRRQSPNCNQKQVVNTPD